MLNDVMLIALFRAYPKTRRSGLQTAILPDPEAVTQEEVNAAIRHYFHSESLFIVIAGEYQSGR